MVGKCCACVSNIERYALTLAVFNLAAQPENAYTLKGFTVGSKCVVWSSLRNTWSKCEILEIAEEGTKVCRIAVKSSVSKCTCRLFRKFYQTLPD